MSDQAMATHSARCRCLATVAHAERDVDESRDFVCLMSADASHLLYLCAA